METKRTHIIFPAVVRLICCTLLWVLPLLMGAQAPVKKYNVHGGKMYIELTREITPASLDSFIVQFSLQDLYLKEFLKNQMADSLLKRGWFIEINNETGIIISKPMLPFANMDHPADRILFTEKHRSFAERFPATHLSLKYGSNRFRNKQPFTVNDSTATFFLRQHGQARRVMLAGSFNDWNPQALAMQKTDSGWVARVPLRPGKYWYKFIVDGRWMVDEDNLIRENDGLGNINSIYFHTNTVFRLHGFAQAAQVYLAGSFNQWRPRELALTKTADGWYLPLYLAEGTHTYKFIVDGKWMEDPAQTAKLPDGAGGFNSVISLGTPHLFELKGHTDAKEVRLAGSFNDWRPFELPMQKTGTGWTLPYVIGKGNHTYKFIVDGKWITDPANPPADREANSILIVQPNYTFRLKGFADAANVFVAGNFNNWDPKSFAMRKEGDEWVLPVHLSSGKYLYKFIVDGKWILDPANKLWEQNEYGTGNSILWLER